MKIAVLVLLISVVQLSCLAQRSSPYLPAIPPVTPRPRPLPLPVYPPVAILPVTGGGDYTYPSMDTPLAPDTNEFIQTNSALAMEPANEFPETNTTDPAVDAAFALTNRLAVIAPAQVLSVMQVQANLNTLENLSTNIDDAQSVQQVVFQNPRLQQQLERCSTAVRSLARGPITPSADSTDRLSMDMLRACSRGQQLGNDHLLVLAIVFNLACNSQNLTPAQIEEGINNGLVILRAAGVQPAVSYPIGCDLRAIAFEVQTNPEM